MFVQKTNSPSFQQLSQEMKQKRALHNKSHKTGRKGYRGKRKEWEEEDAKLAAKGKQNPWDQFPGRLRPYLRARVRKKKKNTSEGSGGITFSNPAIGDSPRGPLKQLGNPHLKLTTNLSQTRRA
jgi:hypothetical protein